MTFIHVMVALKFSCVRVEMPCKGQRPERVIFQLRATWSFQQNTFSVSLLRSCFTTDLLIDLLHHAIYDSHVDVHVVIMSCCTTLPSLWGVYYLSLSSFHSSPFQPGGLGRLIYGANIARPPCATHNGIFRQKGQRSTSQLRFLIHSALLLTSI